VVRQCGVGMFLGQETQKQDDLHQTAMKGQVGVECYGKIMIQGQDDGRTIWRHG
jgi:hypothetical protein